MNKITIGGLIMLVLSVLGFIALPSIVSIAKNTLPFFVGGLVVSSLCGLYLILQKGGVK